MDIARLTPVFDLLDWLLNLGGLALWVNWRAIAHEPSGVPRLSIASTLRRAESRPAHRWIYLVALAALLLLRSLLYWQLGSTAQWMPTLNLGAITLTFRSDLFGRILLYSVASFGLLLFVFHLWLLLLTMVNRRAPETDTHHRLIRTHLGPPARLPLAFQILLPWVAGGLLWWVISFMLVAWGLLPRPLSSNHSLQQAAVIGLCAYLSWKWLLVSVLFVHLINSYVYLGRWAFWQYMSQTGRHLLRPLQWLPLRLGKVDFSPIAGMLFVLIAAQFATRGLHALYRRLPL